MVIGCGVVYMCKCHMPSIPLRVPYRTTSRFLSTVIFVAVNVDVHPSSHSLPVDISALYWRLGRVCYVLALIDNNWLCLSSSLWVACMGLPYGRITHGP